KDTQNILQHTLGHHKAVELATAHLSMIEGIALLGSFDQDMDTDGEIELNGFLPGAIIDRTIVVLFTGLTREHDTLEAPCLDINHILNQGIRAACRGHANSKQPM